MKISPRNAGQMLLVGSVGLMVTMVYHPPGGNIEHLIRTSTIIVASHSVALLAIPFFVTGFWGLSQLWKHTSIVPILSFFIMFVAQLAGMIAASINGLALPLFVTNLKRPYIENETLNLIVINMLAMNHAFDLVFLVGACASILLWSILIIKFNPLPSRVGYFGILISVITLGVIVVESIEINLHTFRLFMSAYLIWTIWVAIHLYKFKEVQLNANVIK